MLIKVLTSLKRAIIINRADKDIKDSVMSNLVPEEKRNILFTTQLSSDEIDHDINDDKNIEKRLDFIEQKLEKLEGIIKKLVDFLVTESQT